MKKYNNLAGYCLIFPWLFGFAFLFFLPMCMSLYYSFTNYNMLTEPLFIGVDNYVRMFTDDPNFWQSLGVTFTYVLVLVPSRLIFAFIIALMLNTKRKGGGFLRTVYYIPSIIGGSIAVSIIWKQLFGNKGVIMELLELIGVNQKLSLIGNPKTALFTIVLLGVWQFGSSMLIFLAALKQIPQSIYESASLDGARGLGKLFHITIPMISPTIFFNLVLQMISGFKVFTEGYIITSGGPMDSTLFYALNLYREAFSYFDMGYSCALAWVLVLIIALLASLVFKSQNFWVYYESKGGE